MTREDRPLALHSSGVAPITLRGHFDARIRRKGSVFHSVRETSRLQQLTFCCCLLAVLAGGLQAWVSRNAINPDGISYLDVADAYRRFDWSGAINGYWSPLYSCLLAVFLSILKPDSTWEFAAAHLVNFYIYLTSLLCFTFLLSEFLKERHRVNALAPERTPLPDWAWIALGYGLFTWTSLDLITLRLVTPDTCVAALVYLAAALLVRVKRTRNQVSVKLFAGLGAVLALGYLAKAAMFPLAAVFLIAALLPSLGSFRRAMACVAAALLVFCLLALPFLAALSMSKGRLTFGDSGKLNYAWYVNRIQFRHWQGKPASYGRPEHTSRKIFDVPAVYEFAAPLNATYPPWFDPSYWYEGLKTRFDLRKQLAAMGDNLSVYSALVITQLDVLAAVAILYLMGWQSWKALRLRLQWEFVYVAAAALTMYALVHVELRFIGAFVVLLWLGLLSGVSLPESAGARKLCFSVSVVLFAMLLGRIVVPSAAMGYEAFRNVPAAPAATEPFDVAAALRRLGIHAGDKVAVIGWGSSAEGAYWARLARLRIVAEIAEGAGLTEGQKFWQAAETTKIDALHALALTGAKVLVAAVPDWMSQPLISQVPWQKLGNTKYSAVLLDSLPKPVLSAPLASDHS